MQSPPNFHFDFLHENASYHADIWHYTHLTPEEVKEFRISEYTYLVKLTGPYPFKPFEIYIGEDLLWHSQSNFVVDDEIVQIIGKLVYHKTM